MDTKCCFCFISFGTHRSLRSHMWKNAKWHQQANAYMTAAWVETTICNGNQNLNDSHHGSPRDNCLDDDKGFTIPIILSNG